MPGLTVASILTLFVLALFAGAGWTLGCWLMSRLLSLISRP